MAHKHLSSVILLPKVVKLFPWHFQGYVEMLARPLSINKKNLTLKSLPFSQLFQKSIRRSHAPFRSILQISAYNMLAFEPQCVPYTCTPLDKKCFLNHLQMNGYIQTRWLILNFRKNSVQAFHFKWVQIWGPKYLHRPLPELSQHQHHQLHVAASCISPKLLQANISSNWYWILGF